ncbi:MAG: M20/M25/M40 family metallo-hydrolase [Thermodesulfovibrionales bacterium]
MAAINTKRLLDTFLDLVRINSPSFREAEIGEYIGAMLRSLGFRTRFQRYDRSFNLISTLKGAAGSGAGLILSAHMDTIEPTEGISYKVTKDRVMSTGKTVLGADDKAAIAQILEAVRVVRESRMPHPDIEIVFTSAEEAGLCGARNLDFSCLKSRHALVLDSGGPVGRLVTAAPTHHTYEMTIIGRSAHAGIEPEQGISAIRVASEIVSKAPDGRINSATTANIGIISGGTATNVVPREVRLRGEVRSHDRRTLEGVKKRIFDRAKKTCSAMHARLLVSVNEEYRSFRISRNDPFLRFVDESHRACGIDTLHVVTGGGSDANVFNASGITAVNMSTGMQKVHSHEEFIMRKDLDLGAMVVVEAIAGFPAAFAGMKKSRTSTF